MMCWRIHEGCWENTCTTLSSSTHTHVRDDGVCMHVLLLKQIAEISEGFVVVFLSPLFVMTRKCVVGIASVLVSGSRLLFLVNGELKLHPKNMTATSRGLTTFHSLPKSTDVKSHCFNFALSRSIATHAISYLCLFFALSHSLFLVIKFSRS
jgi:hypothetical protein